GWRRRLESVNFPPARERVPDEEPRAAAQLEDAGARWQLGGPPDSPAPEARSEPAPRARGGVWLLPAARVTRVAVRTVVRGVVVAVAVSLWDEPLDEALEIVDEGALELVDEERARGVERVDERDARGDRELLDRIPDEFGDIRDFGALLTGQRERGVENLHRS